MPLPRWAGGPLNSGLTANGSRGFQFRLRPLYLLAQGIALGQLSCGRGERLFPRRHGATHDHIAPWRSVFKIQFLTNTDVTFLLASGGHNAGIVSAPGDSQHGYQVMAKPKDGRYLDPDAW